MNRSAERDCSLTIRVHPRSPRSGIKGLMSDGSLKIGLKSPPAEGKANAELVALLSSLFKVPASRVKILTGLSSRQKRVTIRGVTGTEAARIVASIIEPASKKRGLSKKGL